MTRSKEICVVDAVKELVHKAKEAADSNDALKFSQAACNVANAWGSLVAVDMHVKENTG